MKIEKINDNQIRCVLTREDLEARQIKLAELGYGSEKAKALFHEMVKQANEQFEFDVEDMPLMVEAIPSSADSLVLLISKVEYPDELDPRFSRFSDPGEEYFEESSKEAEIVQKGAADIVDFFEKKNQENDKETKDAEKDKEDSSKDLVRAYRFGSMEEVKKLSDVLAGHYHAGNSLFKDEQKNQYVLLMHKNDHTPKEFNRICNRAAEFGWEADYVPAMSAYLEEHANVIIRGEALQLLSQL